MTTTQIKISVANTSNGVETTEERTLDVPEGANWRVTHGTKCENSRTVMMAEVEVRDEDDCCVERVSFQGENLTMKCVLIETEELPERNPFHPQALTKDDLEVGMHIKLSGLAYHKYYNQAMVAGEPYQDADSRWLISVYTCVPKDGVTCGAVEKVNWNLADMGITPSLDPRSGKMYWPAGAYTLAM